MESVGGFTCTVFRDREFMWLVGPKRVETLNTGLDLRNPRSLNEAMAAAARRDMGDEANIDLYWLEIVAPDGSVLPKYRYNAYFDQGWDEGYGQYGVA